METIKDQYQEMIARGTIPVFEFKTVAGEFITVDIGITDSGVSFEFDTEEKDTHFSGNVANEGGYVYVYQFDEFQESLDWYLQEIYQEMVEGYIIPNGIELVED